ncbi:hypothetical protein LXL04_006013 [Taraxacum kok-saghyz]
MQFMNVREVVNEFGHHYQCGSNKDKSRELHQCVLGMSRSTGGTDGTGTGTGTGKRDSGRYRLWIIGNFAEPEPIGTGTDPNTGTKMG